MAQGCDAFERAAADPDALAELPIVQAAAVDGDDLEGEDMLVIAWNAHITATGDQLPAGRPTIRYPQLDPCLGLRLRRLRRDGSPPAASGCPLPAVVRTAQSAS
ncbi:DUF4240 domain-containing protein [Streptomyces sp. 2RAF24]|uniref:DUF4240 domain-containing protein n=1 Tax=Streptomyces sp. 2RAF24 TaxID=3232997 RepID=UPI003F989E7D